MTTSVKRTHCNTWLSGKEEELIHVLIDNLTTDHRVPLLKFVNYFLEKLNLTPLGINATATTPAKTLVNLRGRQWPQWSPLGVTQEELLHVDGDILLPAYAADNCDANSIATPCSFYYRISTSFLAYEDYDIIYELHESYSESLLRWRKLHPGEYLRSSRKNATIHHLRVGLETFTPQRSLFALGLVPTLADHLYIMAKPDSLEIDSSVLTEKQGRPLSYFSREHYYQDISGILSSSGIELQPNPFTESNQIH